MVSQWYGLMDWPVDEDWQCEVCESPSSGLVWGIINGRCRCRTCHAVYDMKMDGKPVSRPVWAVKDKYREAVLRGWKKWKRPISGWTDEMFKEMLELTAREEKVDG